MKQIKRIFIVGHPGAGKAMVARTLAKKLNWEFRDADFGLELQIGREIQEIVGESGLSELLSIQNEMLKHFLQRENIVITTDPTIVLSNENMSILSAEYSVYIKANVDTLLERLEHNPQPLLNEHDIKVLLDQFQQKRNKLYSECTALTVDTDKDFFDQHVAQILDTVKS